MKKNKLIVSYGEGEQGCCICNAPLPPHETWPGARYPFCGSPACSAELKVRKPFSGKGQAGVSSMVGLYFGPDERKCDAFGCDRFLVEGRYDARNTLHACSSKCWVKIHQRSETYVCACGCGTEFFAANKEKRNKRSDRFVNEKHYGAYLKEQHLQARAGDFLPVIREFLNGFAKRHYGEYYTFGKIATFFEYLLTEGVTDLEDVTPRTVTQYLIWAAKADYLNAGRNIPFVATFFHWAIASGLRKSANPVISLLHKQKQPKRSPRPLLDEELEFAWELLNTRGNARLRLAAASQRKLGFVSVKSVGSGLGKLTRLG
jgi:integrase/recombinase XerC